MKKDKNCGCGCGGGGCGEDAGSSCGQAKGCHEQVMEFLDCNKCGQRFNKQLGRCPQCEDPAGKKGE